MSADIKSYRAQPTQQLMEKEECAGNRKNGEK